jgi:D-aminopeptidase
MNPPPHLSDFGDLDTATLMRHLPGVSFPAEKEQVASTAENNGAPQEVVRRIRETSRQRFNNADEVLRAVQGH